VENQKRIGALLGFAARARSVTVGSRETRAGLHRGQVKLVLLAEDGSPRDRERLARIALEQGVLTMIAGTREELGSWIGRGLISVAGITDSGLARSIERAWTKTFREGEGIGENAKE
jgi:ribosomal protein L7Ae-like RNA K-turn-binding protein